MPTKLVFALNVGRSGKGTSFLGCDKQRGWHWSLCHVDLTTRNIVYGDYLAWPIPIGFLSRVNKYIKAVNNNDDISMAHDSKSKCPMSDKHQCGDTCAQFYPLQTCSSICGVVVMITAAIACHNFDFFQHISTAHNGTDSTSAFVHVYLQTSSRFAKYLCLVFASWLASNTVNTEYIIPDSWKSFQHQQVFPSVSNQQPSLNDDNVSTYTGKVDIDQPSNMTPCVISIDEDNGDEDEHSPASIPSDDVPLNCPVPPKKARKDTHSVKKKDHACNECAANFASNFSLQRHMKTKHLTEQQVTSSNCKCHDRGFTCHKIVDFRNHLATVHNMVFRTEHLVMESMTG